MTTIVVVPWHQPEQLAQFCAAWGIEQSNPAVLLQQDRTREGCARTKNRGIQRALAQGVETIIVLDDDCYPTEGQTLDTFIAAHVAALQPQPVPMFDVVTDPPSRGTPYHTRTMVMPVAASMGFWLGVGDYDAPGQLVHGPTHPMTFRREAIHGRYFPLCGMNLAFRASAWPWCQFIDVPRFDDIWQGLLWQRRAYADGQCFNLAGPLVQHARQSNVWANLRDEARHLERNETLWQEVHRMPLGDYGRMVAALFPAAAGPPSPEAGPEPRARRLPSAAGAEPVAGLLGQPPEPQVGPPVAAAPCQQAGPEPGDAKTPPASLEQTVAVPPRPAPEPLGAGSLLDIPPQPAVAPPWPEAPVPPARRAKTPGLAAAGAVTPVPARPPGCAECGTPLTRFDVAGLCARCAFERGR